MIMIIMMAMGFTADNSDKKESDLIAKQTVFFILITKMMTVIEVAIIK